MQAVSASLTESLRTLCRTGGVSDANELEFCHMAHGRIHETYLARGRDGRYILQNINTHVIADPDALARVTDLALEATGQGAATVNWPALDGRIFNYGNGDWLRRHCIEGESLTLPLTLETLHEMGRAMRIFHERISPASFQDCGFAGVNPWSADAGKSLTARLLKDSVSLNAREQAAAQNLVELSSRLDDLPVESLAKKRLTVVHRDTKPSNFLRKTDNSLLLIDFDTLGLGDPVCDLGEAVRALVVDDNDGEASEDPYPVRYDILDAVQALCDGDDQASMQSRPVLRAALSCCLWQAQRFLDDHLAGDVYYSVKVHGENLRHTCRQLQAMQSLFECHAALT